MQNVVIKKTDLYRDFAADVYLPEATSPPRFLFGVVRYRVLNSCRIWSPTGFKTPTPSQPYTTLTQGRWGGRELNHREQHD
jgi:hypothetical protein